MHSSLPKVLQPLAGKSLLSHVIARANSLQPQRISIVHGHGAETVRAAFAAEQCDWILQSPPQGTGDAVKQVFVQTPLQPEKNEVMLVLYGDVPLLQAETLRPLIALAQKGSLALLTQHLSDPTGYGRIIRNTEGAIQGVIEHKDASPEQRTITEINTGILCAPAAKLSQWVSQLQNNNTQKEFYLTDVAALAVAEGVQVEASAPIYEWEAQGVNDQIQLANLERQWQHHLAHQLMAQGVAIADPSRIDIRAGQLIAERDVRIDVGCIFEGKVSLSEGVVIEAHCVLKDSQIGRHTRIKAFSHIENATIGEENHIGPYARIRPGTVTHAQVHVGNFVEVKNSEIGLASKANHLSYLGDTTIGSEVNIGAGVITCNYDGAHKYRTVIGDRAFIGSDTQLVAPVTVGAGATIAAGTTLVSEAPAEQLTLSRTPQRSISRWRRPVKTK